VSSHPRIEITSADHIDYMKREKIMNRSKRYSRQSFLTGLLAALLLITLGGVDKAQAQWSTVVNSPDIYKTDQSGNVGIGTSSPTAKLDVIPANDSVTDGAKVRRTGSASQYGVFNYAYGALMLTAVDTGSPVTNNYGHSFYFNQHDGSTTRTAMFIDGSGNVSIGSTNNSSYRLNLVGDNSSSYPVLKLQNTQTGGHSWLLYSGATSSAGAFGVYDDTASAYRMFFDGGGNIGIGTTTPNAKLDVSGDIMLGGPGTGTLYPSTSGQNIAIRARASDIIFGSSTPVDYMIIKNGGNVGIGQSNPTYKLDVSGNTNVAGNITVTGAGAGNITASGTITGGTINATFQDVAEWVPSTHALAAGTVVILNPAKTNEVMPSTTAYDTRVAGVVSERPGLSLGEAGKDKALVATTGRVKVMVDATKSPIHVGDLLVTSDEEGVAMKSEPVDIGGVKLHRPGTLIGKALEPLENGKGQILVLLSLQ
jgi:hypothetical protein